MSNIRVAWYSITDTVVLTREEDGHELEELCEVPRAEWEQLVAAIRAGEVETPWEAV